ncbi:MAG: PQQ-dependent sugar dehydrogenase [Methanospirillum sp.]
MAFRSVLVLLAVALAAVLAAGCTVPGGLGGIPPSVSTFSPERVAFDESLLSRLTLPPNFTVGVFAKDLGGVRVLVAAPDGTVYASVPSSGTVLRLRDANGDGRAETVETVLRGYAGVHGLALGNGSLYFATPTTVYAAPIGADGAPGTPRIVADGLPSGGNHQAPGLGLSPDGRLYLTLGSTCNACQEASPERAAMLLLENGTRRVYAKGLRNTMGFDWNPVTGQLYGVDQGVDLRGDDLPPDEINRIVDGGNYGWPYVYGKQVPDGLTPFDPPGTTKEAFAATTEPSAIDLPAHSSPIQLRFYNGTAFPAEYRGDAFVTLHGSWNRNPPNGYRVVRLRFSPAGEPEGYEDFLTGFLYDGTKVFGRPAGLAAMPDGALLVGDDFNGVVYRVAFAAS